MLTIGRIPFLNCDPYYAALPDLGWRVKVLPPKPLGILASEGLIDAAPLSLVDTWRLKDEYEPLESWGIAVREQSYSILFFSKKPLQELTYGLVAVTQHSSTAIRLLEVILRERYNSECPLMQRAAPQEGDEGFLAIGNEALQAELAGKKGYPYGVDLASVWWEWQRLPFTFARWVVRKKVPEDQKEVLRKWLEHSLNKGLSNIEALAASRSKELGLPEEKITRYLKNFVYPLGRQEQLGIGAFYELWQKWCQHDKFIPSPRPTPGDQGDRIMHV